MQHKVGWRLHHQLDPQRGFQHTVKRAHDQATAAKLSLKLCEMRTEAAERQRDVHAAAGVALRVLQLLQHSWVRGECFSRGSRGGSLLGLHLPAATVCIWCWVGRQWALRNDTAGANRVLPRFGYTEAR